MNFSNEDFENITKNHIVPRDQKGFIVLLGGNMFESSSGKSLFKKRNHAISALNHALCWRVKHIVSERLKDIGLTGPEISRNSEYIGAWKNFVKQAEASGFLQVVKLQ